MEKVFAIPKEDVLVRHETGKALDAKGDIVERNSYWLRRERDGDVTLGPVPDPAVEPLAVADPATAKKPAKA